MPALTWLSPVLLLPAALLALLAGGLMWRREGDRPGALLRALVVLALGAALAQPLWLRRPADAALLVLGATGAVQPGAVDEALAVLAPPGAGVGLLTAAGLPDDGDSLAGALDAARRALPGGGRVVLLGADARVSEKALAVAAAAREAGLRVDALALPRRTGTDAAVTAVDAPATWRAGEALPVVVSLRASGPAAGRLELWRDGALAATAPVTVGTRPRAIRLRSAPPAPGPIRWQARVAVAGDPMPDNDRGSAVTRVAPAPRVLVAGDGLAAVALADALTGAGLRATVVAPGRLPGRLSALEAWDVLALVDVPAADLAFEQQAAVAAFPRRLGRGLLLVGGRQSFRAGGWAGTPLAQVAPLDLEPPPRERRDALALLLLVDQSASMGSTEGPDGRSKLALAREAAMLAAEALHPGDTLGVLAYDDAPRWLVPPAPVGEGRDLAAFERALGGLSTGGGTNIGAALALGLPELAGLSVPTRHALLVTDGRDFQPEVAAIEARVAAARAAGATLSTIAVGEDADLAFLAGLAERGRGRFYQATDPGDLPRLAAEESETVRAGSAQRGHFRVLGAPGAAGQAAVAGVDLADLPELTGYLAMTARPGAAVALQAPNGDPLLAVWQLGLGRVAAWASDAGDDWAAAWPGRPATAGFWARVVRYLAAAPAQDTLVAELDPLARPPRLTLTAEGPDGEPLDLAEARLVVTDTGGARVLPLPQVAPGQYAGPAPADGGEGVVADALLSAAGEEWRLALGWGAAAPPGHWPAAEGPAGLAALAAAGGGTLLAAPKPLASPGAASLALWPFCAALALFCWLWDIAWQEGAGAGPRRRLGRAISRWGRNRP